MAFRIQKTALASTINKNNLAVELGNTSIHSAYMLECTITATNGTGASKTPTIAEFLGVLEQINVVSNNTNYHYSWSGTDIARRNAMKTAMNTTNRVLDMTFSAVASTGEMAATFVLWMDEGDVIALMHDTVTLKAQLANYLAESCPVTAVTIKPTIIELVPAAGLADIKARYGEKYEGALEPKVYVREKKCDANTTFTEFFELPTGALLRGAMLKWSVAPSQFGIVATVPSRSELMRMNWTTAVASDEIRFRVKMPDNTNYIDYNAELAFNGLGIDGRNFNLGDYKIAAYSTTETTLRYVSFELTYPSTAGGNLVTNHSAF